MRLKPIISLGNATVEKLQSANEVLTLQLNRSGSFTASLSGPYGIGETPQEALANLELAIIDAETSGDGER